MDSVFRRKFTKVGLGRNRRRFCLGQKVKLLLLIFTTKAV